MVDGGMMKKLLYDKFSSQYLLMIDVENLGKSSRALQVMVLVSIMSADSLECQKRALLEREQQFYGNKGLLLC